MSSPPNNFAAPLWADLTNSVGGHIYTKDLGDSIVIEWWHVSYQGTQLSSNELTFEIILYKNSNRILFQYHTIKGMNVKNYVGTVGIEYLDGKEGKQYSYNQKDALKSGMAILFVPGVRNSTREVVGCYFWTQTQYRGCDQLDPFGADIFEGLLPSVPPFPIFSIERVGGIGINRWPANYISVGQYARYSLNPPPPMPFDPQPLVCYRYSLPDILKAGGHANNLFIASYDPIINTWQKLPTVVDQERNVLTTAVNHFSVYGVFATRPEALPVTGSFLPEPIRFMIAGMIGVLAMGIFLQKSRKKRN